MKAKYLTSVVLLGMLSIASKDKIQDYSKVLPGVVMISENLYYDKIEASNFYWLEYLHWTKTNNPDLYKSNLPDTNVWTSELTYNEPYVKLYMRHAAYRYYPVVGVSWEQANTFCKWRTERVEEHLKNQGKRDKAPKKFTYRLPTYEEYLMMYADIQDLSNTIGEEGKKKYRGMIRYNMKRESEDLGAQAGMLNDNADVTAPVTTYWPNKYGVYNTKGNVAEWLSDSNTYAGGSWMTPMSEDVSVVKTSKKPSAAIGFRCVCEISDEDFPSI